MVVYLLLIADVLMLVSAGLFAFCSILEREPRAPKIGYAGIILSIIFAVCILWVPALRIPVTVFFALGAIFGAICIIPGKPDPKVLKGTLGYVVGKAQRFDERDIVFARFRIPPDQQEIYRRYYEMYP